MCTTQQMTITNEKGETVQVEDTQDCGKSTCVHSAHYKPPTE